MQRASKAAQGHLAAASRMRSSIAICRAAVAEERIVDKTKKPCFPFVKIAGQEDMKLALCLNVVDPNIGGCLIMGDRGTGKSVAVS
jgi:magnesium chelatase subunit I